jgi:hypothetical protein
LAQLIEGKYVSCIDHRPRGDAVAVVCAVPVGDVGQMMVQDGMAVVPFELSKAYLGDQIHAKSSARGIWAGTVENPWEYRAKLEDGPDRQVSGKGWTLGLKSSGQARYLRRIEFRQNAAQLDNKQNERPRAGNPDWRRCFESGSIPQPV